jgi:hypothetical protein
MRKAILSISAIFAFVTITNAQEQKTVAPSHSKLKIGYRLGANLTDLFVENVEKETPKIGFAAGFYIRIPMSPKVTFAPEINYTYNGAKITYNNAVQGTGRYRFNLGYVQIPALFSYKATKIVKLYAGPYIAFLTDVNIKRLDSDNGAVTSVTNLRKGDFNSTDVGVAGGIGFDINRKTTIGARYSYGFNEVGKADNHSQVVLTNSKNCVLNVYVSFGF